MTTLTDRPNTALIVVDVQNDVLNGSFRRDTVLANIVTLLDKARTTGTPVVWVQHSSDEMPKESAGWQFVSELAPADAEPLVHKRYADAFEETELERVLADGGIGAMVLAGAQTDECIRSTLHGAIARGYDAILVSDAHTTEDLSEWGAPTPDKVINHTNLYWSNHRAPGRRAGTVATDEVTFG